MRQIKTVYLYNSEHILAGTSIAIESWDFDGTFITPPNSTDIEPPTYNENTEYVKWSIQNNEWVVLEKPNELNTPKPEHNANTHHCIWGGTNWNILERPNKENSYKPIYNIDFEELVWENNAWVIKQKINWETVRLKRFIMLQESDWIGLTDVNLPNKQQWIEYRQALRDIPQNYTYPEDVVWPDKP